MALGIASCSENPIFSVLSFSSHEYFFPKLELKKHRNLGISFPLLLSLEGSLLYVTFWEVSVKVPKYEMHRVSRPLHTVAVEEGSENGVNNLDSGRK